MGYYTRVLSTKLECFPFERIVDSLSKRGFGVCGLEKSHVGPWDSFEVVDIVLGEVVLLVEYNPIIEGELGHEEMEEFREEVKTLKPAQGAYWLGLCFDLIKSIYAFQHLLSDDAVSEKGFEAATIIKTLLASDSYAIRQADFEGFTNFNGDYIVWQFDENAKAVVRMAILKSINFSDLIKSKWESFEINISNQEAKARFIEGKHPHMISFLGLQFPRLS